MRNGLVNNSKNVLLSLKITSSMVLKFRHSRNKICCAASGCSVGVVRVLATCGVQNGRETRVRVVNIVLSVLSVNIRPIFSRGT